MPREQKTCKIDVLLKPWQLTLLERLLTNLLYHIRYGEIRVVVVDGKVSTIKFDQSFDVRRPVVYEPVND